ncbi:MAG TPA: TolC family protein [Rhizobacter sp.]|nr:TolC family protein [Rhizobacter sp.]
MVSTMSRLRASVALAVLSWPLLSQAGLSFEQATQLAREQAPALVAQRSALAGAQASQQGAATLPDPRVTLGVDNLPISGPDRGSLTADFMTMQRIGLMQEVPNSAKREARANGAQARIAREQALLAATQLAVQRESALAWLNVYFAERRLLELKALDAENRVLLDTLGPRIAAGKAMPADRLMAQQEALALADRRDDALRDIAKARSALRRWVGARADEPLAGTPPHVSVDADAVRLGLHRHAELAPYEAMRAMALAEVGEASAESKGDWGWEVVYSRRGPQYGDMVSFQVSLDLPWQRGRRQEPQLLAKLRDVDRIEAERDELARRHREEVENQLAELQALDAQRARLQSSGQVLAAERVALALASYQAGRGDLSAVLAARREAVETGLRLIELDLQRSALSVRLTTLISEQ